MNFFGRSKKSAPPPKTAPNNGGGSNLTDPGSGLQKVKSSIERLEKRQELLEKKVKLCMVEAKRKSQAKNKSGAMQELKRKKMYEKEINKIQQSILNLEQQVFAIEGASATKDIIDGLKTGKEATSRIMKDMNIEQIEDLQADIQEQLDISNEVNEVLGQSLTDGLEDDDELLAELDELDSEEALNELETVQEETSHVAAPSMSLPSAPSGQVKVKATEVDEDEAALAALAAEFA